MLLQMLPAAHWDAMLLRMFPGRTLEELDAIDWPRLMCALQVQELDRIEDAHNRFLAGKSQPTPDEWRKMLRHNRLSED